MTSQEHQVLRRVIYNGKELVIIAYPLTSHIPHRSIALRLSSVPPPSFSMSLLSTCACVRVGGLASIASDDVICRCHCPYVPSPSSPAPPPLPSSPSHRCLCVLTVMIIVASWHPVTSITPSSSYVVVPPSVLLVHPRHHRRPHFHYFFVSSPVRPCARHHRGTQPHLSHRRYVVVSPPLPPVTKWPSLCTRVQGVDVDVDGLACVIIVSDQCCPSSSSLTPAPQPLPYVVTQVAVILCVLIIIVISAPAFLMSSCVVSPSAFPTGIVVVIVPCLLKQRRWAAVRQ